MQSYTRILFGLCCCLFSCLQPPNELEVVENKPMSALVVPSGFKFSTIHNLYLKIGAVDNYQKALKRNALGSAPYNPFLIAHGDRGVEIHLPLHPPTDLAQFSLFGTLDDDSIKTRWEIWLRTKFINVITIPEKNILRTQY